MKKILFLFCLIPLYTQAQYLGDTQDKILENLDIKMYRVNENYYELVDTSNNALTIYLLGLSSRKVYGIDYVFHNDSLYNQKLEELTANSESFGYKMWIKDNDIIIYSNICEGLYNIFIRNLKLLREDTSEID